MKPTLAVYVASDSFSQEWSRLAASGGADLFVVRAAADLAGRRTVGAVLIAAGGEERSALPALSDLRASGAPVAVAGTSTDYWTVRSILRAGADEYFALPDEWEALRVWVADRAARDDQSLHAAPLAPARWPGVNFSSVIGRSAALQQTLARAAKIVGRDVNTLLLTGETGTGKGMLAEAIHRNGPRAHHRFVQVNCAALPATLLESELFGHERGAFTDAKATKPGLFELADGGTIFLDEMSDLPLALQPKLLRVLDDRRVRRLGAVRERAVDVRVIAASHDPLAAAVRDGRFREDLYCRLNVIALRLPALRERGDDVLLLAEHFVTQCAEHHRLPRPTLTAHVRRALLGHSWPGNVRALRNAIERALLLGDGELRLEDLLSDEEGCLDPLPLLPIPARLADIERVAARAAVERSGGNKSAAAYALGISRSHLYTLLGDAVSRSDTADWPPADVRPPWGRTALAGVEVGAAGRRRPRNR